jgi:hypothetical protein
MRKIAILLTLLVLLQGCVSPKTGQLSIPLPKNISYPSALVIKDKYLGVLSMEGKFDPLYKVDGNFSKKESNYFIVKNPFLLFPHFSFWKLDMSSKKLICLISRIQASANTDYISKIYVSSDEKYVVFSRSNIFGPSNEDVFYSLFEQKEVKPPRFDGSTLIHYFTTDNPSQFLLVYNNQNKDEKKVFQQLYLWDIKNKSIKNIEFPKLIGYSIKKVTPINSQGEYFVQTEYLHYNHGTFEHKASGFILDLLSLKTKFVVACEDFEREVQLNISEDRKVMYFYEGKNLCQYDFITEKNEKLMESLERPIIDGFIQTQYLLISFDTHTIIKGKDGKEYFTFGNTKHDFYLMNSDKKWIQLSQKFKNCEIRDCELTNDYKVLIALENQEKKIQQVLKWDPEKDAIRVLFETRNKKINLVNIEDFSNQLEKSYETSYSKKFIKIGLKDSEPSCFLFQYILNMNTLEIREIKKIPNEICGTGTYSYEDSIWYTKNFPIHDSKYGTEFLYYLDWDHPEKIIPINLSENNQYRLEQTLEHLSPDTTYLPFSDTADRYPNGKLRIVNTRTGKELAFPESKDFQFITWMEEK